MTYKPLIFVDGQEGTTGLKIRYMLAERTDLDLLEIASEKRKDPSERARLINSADLVFLCLPDAASRESTMLVSNPNTRLIDTSTAFRTDPNWVYGLPEISINQREKIRSSRRVANPGCHATAFILVVRPLQESGLLPPTYPLSATSITGFSGGGKRMIEEYKAAFGPTRDSEGRKAHATHAIDGTVPENPSLYSIFINELAAPRPYSLSLGHKHLPEMIKYAGLAQPPLFLPVVGPFFQGLTVTIPISGLGPDFGKNAQECLAERYRHETFIRVRPLADPDTISSGFFNIQRCNKTNRVDLFVFQNELGQVLLMSCIDNLGKGASGAAVQNMNLMLGLEETTGLAVT